MKHPYKEYESSKFWGIIKSSIEELVENNDIENNFKAIVEGAILGEYKFTIYK